MADLLGGMTTSDVPDIAEVIEDSIYDPLISIPAEWEEFSIKAVIQSLGKTFIDVDQKGGRVVHKSWKKGEPPMG
jgi:hypothetical protein